MDRPTMRDAVLRPISLLALAVVAGAGCVSEAGDAPADAPEAPALTPERVARLAAPTLHGVIEGFEGPESTFHDAEQDVWFVSSFTGPSGERDADGTISRVDGATLEIVALDWARDTDEAPFHAGRGMAIQGDTLWVADIDGVHGFHRATGEQLAFVDLSATEPGFLNDVAVDPNGMVWVTDTGSPRLIQVRPDAGLVVDLPEATGSPNGILHDPAANGFWIAPWTAADSIRIWDPVSGETRVGAVSPGATRVDGLVHWRGLVLAGVQADPSIHLLPGIGVEGTGFPWIALEGRPADIGIDSGRDRLAIPYVARNLVEIWALPDPAAAPDAGD